MKTFKSEWKDRDLRNVEENNKLFEIVQIYGAYLNFIDNGNKGGFIRYYKVTEAGTIVYKYINRAHRDIDFYLKSLGIRGTSSTKMKKLLFTKKGKRVVSYEWFNLYFNYLMEKVFSILELKEYIFNEIINGCTFCEHSDSMQIRSFKCSRRILGFQFAFWRKLKESKSEKITDIAQKFLSNIENNVNLQYISANCNNSEGK